MATLESLSCATPIIATMTGGLQDQLGGGNYGIPLIPTSKSVIGSQQVPYIYEDRINKGQFTSALTKISGMASKSRRDWGMEGRQFVMDNFGFEQFNESWVKLMLEVYEKHGSWDTRKNYNGIQLLEVA